jgi:AcrR family transcriptional regulator
LPAEPRKDAQRSRLLDATLAVSAELGYEAVTITRIVTAAGVSRPAFYEHFASKQACFLTALQDVEVQLLASVAAQIARRGPQSAAPASIVALAQFAQAHSALARPIMNETMAAGPGARDARDRAIGKIARLIDDSHESVARSEPVPALPAQILVGGVFRVLARRLQQEHADLVAVAQDLVNWAVSYSQPAGEQRWRSVRRNPATPRSPFLLQGALRAPAARAPGSSRRRAAHAAHDHRLRIILAAAEIVRQDGYEAASVARIARTAGVEPRVFYQLFEGKQDAFRAVHEFAFQRTMAACAGAYFAVEDWPARIWEAARAGMQRLDQDRVLAHASLVESHAGGPDAARRFDELVAGFTIFLQEGYQYQPAHGIAPSRVALEAIAQTNFEMLYREARNTTGASMSPLAAQFTYICLAPFLGPARAGELIDETLAKTPSAELE